MRSTSAAVMILCVSLLAACGEQSASKEERPAPTPEAPAVEPPPAPAPGTLRDVDLEDLEATSLPASWTVAEGTWKVTESQTLGMRVFQDARHENHVFNVALMPATFAPKDVRLEVTVDAVTGELDQGGGPVWRAKDGANYYVARWNPLEDNFRVYTVVGGVRTELASAEVKAEAGPHVLQIEMRGTKIHASFDGRLLIEVEDDTFGDAGRIGLWTKADARTGFSRLTAQSLDGSR